MAVPAAAATAVVTLTTADGFANGKLLRCFEYYDTDATGAESLAGVLRVLVRGRRARRHASYSRPTAPGGTQAPH